VNSLFFIDMKIIIVDDDTEQGDMRMFFINPQSVEMPDVSRANIPE